MEQLLEIINRRNMRKDIADYYSLSYSACRNKLLAIGKDDSPYRPFSEGELSESIISILGSDLADARNIHCEILSERIGKTVKP
jgi:hypothetical protein